MIEYYKKVVFDNYANFEGRARRSEYWYFILCQILLMFVFAVLGGVMIALLGIAAGAIVTYGLLVIYFIGTIVPTIAVAVRRLHDQGKSGSYYFVSFIPFIGGLWMLYLMCTDGDYGPNAYGKDPKQDYEDLEELGVTQA